MIARAQSRDSGYGWVVVAAFFLIEVLVDGVRFSFGLFFVEFLAEFEKGKANTAGIGATMMGVYNLSGPIFSLIVNKVGYRKASVIGSLIATTGFILSSFATEIYHLYFTFGVLQGFGYGLVFLSGTVTIGMYFYKRRALAIGISFCGSGVGTFVISPLIRLLLETYTWRGTMFILAGMALNGCVLSALYRPIETENNIFKVNLKEDREDNPTGIPEDDEIDIAIKQNGKVSNGDPTGIPEDDENDIAIKKNGKVSNGDPTGIPEDDENYKAIKKNGTVPNGTHSPLLENHTKQNGFSKDSKDNKASAKSTTKVRTFDDLRKERFKSFTEGTDHGSHRSLNLSVLSQSILGSNASFEYIFDKRIRHKTSHLTLDAPSIISVKTVLDDSGKRFKYSVIENIFPRTLITNINFIIMMISTVFVGLMAFVPFSMLPDYAMSEGATKLQGAWLLSTLGIGGTVSRIGAGILSDLPCVHRLTLLGVCLFTIGATTIVVALVPLYEVLISYSTLYGMFFGATYVVQPLVLLEYFGEQFISEVMGISMCVYGVSGFIGVPLAGWIFDITGSYQISFLTVGLSFSLGGFINFMVLCTKPSRQARHLKKLDLELEVEDEEKSTS